MDEREERSARVLTGDRPTGRLHLGHYVGTLKNRLGLQKTSELFIVIADYHVLTTTTGPKDLGEVSQHIHDMVLDYLSVGIDPEKTTIYVQSQVPQVCELELILSMFVSVAQAQRVPTIKELVAAGDSPSMGLLSYPILQAADILLMRAGVVPVGKDQEPHVEMCREMARRFNRLYGQTFPEPQALLSDTPLLVGIDGKQKMSKSFGNAIYLSESEEGIRKKIMSMYTDPKRIHSTDPGRVEGNPVFIYHDLFNSDRNEVEQLKSFYRNGRVGDVEVKNRLLEALNRFLLPFRTRRVGYAAEPNLVKNILANGRTKALAEAQKTLKSVRAALGLFREADA